MNTQNLVEALFSQPTAPFREGFVLQKIEQILRQKKIPYFYDGSQNLIAGCKNAKELKQAHVALLAHTDHPGFHVVKQTSPTKFKAHWLGGAPFSMMKGSKIRVYSPTEHKSWKAKIMSELVVVKGKSRRHFEAELTEPVPLPKNAFGAFDFPAYRFQKERISARVADDLAGCVIALGALMDSARYKSKGVAIFTRSEEVGFVGCIEFLKKNLLSPKTKSISLEASKELVGAKIGQGPVLRLGDRTSLFHTAFSQEILSVTLKKKLPYQRRIMEGGSCEATALTAFGYVTAGISVPLGNYHNQGRRSPQPEVISLKDVDVARQICAEVIKQAPRLNWNEKFKKQMLKWTREFQKDLHFDIKKMGEPYV